MNNNELDILKKIEETTSKLNEIFSHKTKPVFNRYPLTFAILVIFGITLFSLGMKEYIIKIEFFKGEPFLMIIIGITILILTGTLYKKLDK